MGQLPMSAVGARIGWRLALDVAEPESLRLKAKDRAGTHIEALIVRQLFCLPETSLGLARLHTICRDRRSCVTFLSRLRGS